MNFLSVLWNMYFLDFLEFSSYVEYVLVLLIGHVIILHIDILASYIVYVI